MSSAERERERGNTPPPFPFAAQPASSLSANISPAVASPSGRRREEIPPFNLADSIVQDGGTISPVGSPPRAPDSPRFEPEVGEIAGEPAMHDDIPPSPLMQPHIQNLPLSPGAEVELQQIHSQPTSPVPVPQQISPLHSPLFPEDEPVTYLLDSLPDTDHTPAGAREMLDMIPPTPEITPETLSTTPPTNLVTPIMAFTPPVSPNPNAPALNPTPSSPVPTHAAAVVKLPPIVDHCEHMTYPPFSDSFQPFANENFNLPLQDFYRLLIGSNFWGEVNDICGYTGT